MNNEPTNSLHAPPELLAPAGDFTCLEAALQAGADAVYFGVGDLNMRVTARNFGRDDLPEISRRCRAAGARAYLALNTIVFGDEREAIRSLLKAALGQVDAVICWDPAVIGLCRELGHEIHISTQASVANPDAAAFYKTLGATRVVPARECSLAEVKRIREQAGIEVETFVHGAMCVSFSGRCFLSQDVFGKSGNRGACLQPCRREYRVTEVEDGDEYILGEDYVMSARDLCTIPFFEQVIEAGIDSCKIEGRNRNPEYVDTVTRCYRRAIDAYFAGTLDQSLKDELMATLHGVFHRTFSDGFYHGRPVASFTQSRGSQAEYRKESVGLVTNYYKRIRVVEIQVQSNSFSPGDELMIQGPTTGVVRFSPDEILVEGEPVEAAPRAIVTCKLAERVRPGDKVFIRVLRQGKRFGE
jgi:putative protease